MPKPPEECSDANQMITNETRENVQYLLQVFSFRFLIVVIRPFRKLNTQFIISANNF